MLQHNLTRSIILIPDSLQIFPVEYDVKYRRKVKIKCESITKVSWKHNDNPVLSNTISTQNSIVLLKINKNKRGQYECEGVNKNSQSFIAISTINVVCKLLMMNEI